MSAPNSSAPSSHGYYDHVARSGDDLSNGRRLNPVQALLYNPKIAAFYEEHCTYLPAMACWFLFSALLSSYNKFVFGDDKLNFPCPLLLTSVHFGTQWVFSYSMCKLYPTYFGAQRINDMSWSEFLGISIPCGLVTSGDVGLSNLSMVTMSITFYTMVKSSTPVFVLVWAYFFGIVKITWTLIGVVVVIFVGEFLTVAGEVDFVLHGFLLCLMASCLSGARWTLVQLKIQKLDPPLKTTVATMRVLAPFMFTSMLLVAFAVEQPWKTLDGIFDSWHSAFYMLQLGLLGAVFAIFMILAEFYLIMYSNAIVLMVGGVIKEILTIFIGVNFFGDTINTLNFIGCCTVFLGIVLYKVAIHMEKEEAKAKAKGDMGIVKSRANSVDRENEETRERQPLQMKDESSNNDGYHDEDRSRTNSNNGIEMRRALPLRNRSSDALDERMDMKIV